MDSNFEGMREETSAKVSPYSFVPGTLTSKVVRGCGATRYRYSSYRNTRIRTSLLIKEH